MSSELMMPEIKPVNALHRYLTVAQMLMLPSIYLSFHYAWNSGVAESLFAFIPALWECLKETIHGRIP
jgi:glucose-6-phosphate-specific signal transduction histidine kinase